MTQRASARHQMTSAPIAVIAGVPISVSEALGAALSLLAALVALSLIALWRAGAARRREREIADERQEAIEARFAALAQSSAELSGRIGGMSEWLGSRQTDLARVVADRLEFGRRATRRRARRPSADDRRKSRQAQRAARRDRRGAIAHERNDARSRVAQGHSLQQAVARRLRPGEDGGDRARRLARGRLRVPVHALQPIRPDCVIRLPGDARLLAVDAKFPLEGFTALRAARDDETRKTALARVRTDVGKHVKDIAERYLLPGETQDVALMFVPSEAIYSDLVDHFDELVQKAHRARVVIVSPTLMMMAISVAQAILRDARMRDETHAIQAEVGKLMNDVRLLVERRASSRCISARRRKISPASARRARGLRGGASGSNPWTFRAKATRRLRTFCASRAAPSRRAFSGRSVRDSGGSRAAAAALHRVVARHQT